MLIYIQSREFYFIILHGLNLASDHTHTPYAWFILFQFINLWRYELHVKKTTFQ